MKRLGFGKVLVMLALALLMLFVSTVDAQNYYPYYSSGYSSNYQPSYTSPSTGSSSYLYGGSRYYKRTTYVCRPVHTYYRSYPTYPSYRLPTSGMFPPGQPHIWGR